MRFRARVRVEERQRQWRKCATMKRASCGLASERGNCNEWDVGIKVAEVRLFQLVGLLSLFQPVSEC